MSRDAEGRPGQGAAPKSCDGDCIKSTSSAEVLADVDALAEHLRGYLAVQVVVDDDGHRRTTLYRSAAAAERAVKRAHGRGRHAHTSLVQLMPVGVVTSLTGAASTPGGGIR